MGCKDSKQSGQAELPVVSLDLSGMDRISKFEYMLPFQKTKIEVLD